MNTVAGPRHSAGTLEKTAMMAPARATGPQERGIQTVRPVLRRKTAVRGMTAGGRAGVRLGLMAMTVLSVTIVQVVMTGHAAMIVRAGMTAVAVTTVRIGKVVRIGRVSQTVQIVQIALSARTGLIGPIGPISRGAKIATTVRKDRAGRTERIVEALLTSVRAASALAIVVLASLQARVVTNPRVYGFGTDVFVCVAPTFLAVKFRGGLLPPPSVHDSLSLHPTRNFWPGMFLGSP